MTRAYISRVFKNIPSTLCNPFVYTTVWGNFLGTLQDGEEYMFLSGGKIYARHGKASGQFFFRQTNSCFYDHRE